MTALKRVPKSRLVCRSTRLTPLLGYNPLPFSSGQTADEFRSAGRSDLFAAQGSALASLISIQCPSGSWK